MREAQVALARIEGHGLLLASLHNTNVGGPKNSELSTLTSLGRDAGIGVKVSNSVGHDHPINDAAHKLLPIQPQRVYLVSDSTLKLKSKKRRLGVMGRRLRSQRGSSRMASRT